MKDLYVYLANLIALTLFIVVLSKSEWPCGLLLSEICLRFKPVLPTVAGMMITSFIFLLASTIVGIVLLFNKNEDRKRHLHIAGCVSSGLAAVFALIGMWWYYYKFMPNFWCQEAGFFIAGMLTAIGIVQFSFDYP
ncbi:unnamed protein product [Rodentolepis nana]|uniref:Epithelial membrane protein 2 n=1 Tax=Rodentolepis nana TaxID=102285 RepID=A0A0R3TEZ5_RODNA|nr:unnamed protein product [Rodentolepis nana]